MERVLCLRAPVWGIPTYGFIQYEGHDWLSSQLDRWATWEDRDEGLESNTSRKQVIPYVVLLNESRVFAYRRYSKADKRLAGKWSVGVGGHVNPEDGEGWQAVSNCAHRELQEEVGIDAPTRFHGIINDEFELVGRVHLGLLFSARVEATNLSSSEGVESDWIDVGEALSLPLERWSRLALEGLGMGV